MTKKKLSIHSENILPIIKKWLYSDKNIFLRELVSNACDAIQKLKILSSEENVKNAIEDRIDIRINKDEKTITIEDTGIGMTQDEVEKYIAQIAFSGAEDFLKKYKSPNEKDQIIGHFGLGFFSAYMVAKNVEIFTLSYEEGSEAVHWLCDGSSEYTIEKTTKEQRGTKIILHIDEESQEYLNEDMILNILKEYCTYLSHPIYFNDKRLNEKLPLWLKNPSECSDKEYIDFYHDLYPLDEDPVFWVHLNIDFPFNLKGILYFPKINKRFDFQKSVIKLFCNRVFVSDHCKDLFPDYLTVLRGAIDSIDLPLNVSRSSLQMDQKVRQLAKHISKKIALRLSSFYQEEREKFISIWKSAEPIIKLGILQDDKFYDRVKNFLIWKNLNQEWTTIDEYLTKYPEKKIYYTEDADNAFLLQMFSSQKEKILHVNNMIDPSIIQFLEGKLEVSFQRIDAELDPSLIDSSREKSLLDAEGKSESAKIADFIRSHLQIKDLEIEAKSLVTDGIPAFLVSDEKSRRMNEYMQMAGNGMELPMKQTLVINTNNTLLKKAFALQTKSPDLAKELAFYIYDLAKTNQKTLEPTKYKELIFKQTQLMQKVFELI